MSFIKIDRTLAERLTLLLGWLANRGYDEPYTLIRTSYEECGWNDSPGRIFPDLTKAGFNSLRDLAFKSLMDQAVETLKGGGSSEAHFPALVATIVELIQHPYGQSVMAGDTLRKLRKAILFPEELAKVSANANSELNCGACGKPFRDGEMATFMHGDRQVSFACSRCTQPVYASCGKAGCDCSGEIDHKAIAKTVSKADCGQHTKVEPIPADIRNGGIIPEVNPFEGDPEVAIPRWAAVGRDRPRPEEDPRRRRPGNLRGIER